MKTTRKAPSKSHLKQVEKALNCAADFVALTNQARDIADRLKVVKAELEAFALTHTDEFDKNRHYKLGPVTLKWGDEGKLILPENLDNLRLARALPNCVKIEPSLSAIKKMLADADNRTLITAWGIDVKMEPKLKIEIAQ